MKRILARYSPLFILAALCAIMAIIEPAFRQEDNIQNLLYRTSVVGIIAAGQTLVILSAGIDLSVGSVAALAGVVACMLMKAGWPMAPATAAGALVGMLCGSVNGFLSTKGKLPPFIATLGMMMAARGVVLLISGAKQVSGMPPSFRYLGGTGLIGADHRAWWIPVLITAAIVIGLAVVLTFTRFGRALYATGGNAQGARLSGVPTDRVRIVAYSLCGLLTGFAGVLLASRVGIADPAGAEGLELDAIAACVIGGASLMGGEGGCIGSMAGALIMNVLVNFCTLRGYDAYWQKVLVGALVVVLVYYDTLRKRRAGLIRD